MSRPQSLNASLKNLIVVAICLTSLGQVPGLAHAAGTLYFNRDGSPTLYTLNTSTGQATSIGASGVTSNTTGLTETGNSSLLLGGAPFGLLRVNADGSGATVINASPVAEGLAYDPTTNIAYSWWQDTGFDSLNPVTGNKIADLPGPPDSADIEGLAYLNGSIYGLAGFGGPRGNLYRYNIAGNSWSFVGFTGIQFNETGLAADPQINTLYAIGSQDGNLYRLNPSTAAAQVIGPTGLPAVGGGLAFIVAVPEPTAICLAGMGFAAACVSVRRIRAKR
jgi:hypothetical protein